VRCPPSSVAGTFGKIETWLGEIDVGHVVHNIQYDWRFLSVAENELQGLGIQISFVGRYPLNGDCLGGWRMMRRSADWVARRYEVLIVARYDDGVGLGGGMRMGNFIFGFGGEGQNPNVVDVNTKS